MLKELIGKFAHMVAFACDCPPDPQLGPCIECVIPETLCPPRCVGTIAWKIARGAQAEASIVVRNVGLVARPFAFSASGLAGLTPGTAALLVQPTSAALDPGQSVIVRVSLQNSASLTACQQYSAEVTIKGSWEQCVQVALHVQPDPFDSVGVEQSDSVKDRLLHPAMAKHGVDWKIQRGVVPQAAITVHNIGSAAETFQLESTPLVGPDSGTASLSLQPSSLRISPRQSATAQLKLQNTAGLSPGQDYRAEIIIRGFHERRLTLHCQILIDASEHCQVEQGEAPTRKRAHQWYDHFQCTQACPPSTA